MNYELYKEHTYVVFLCIAFSLFLVYLFKYPESCTVTFFQALTALCLISVKLRYLYAVYILTARECVLTYILCVYAYGYLTQILTAIKRKSAYGTHVCRDIYIRQTSTPRKGTLTYHRNSAAENYLFQRITLRKG